MKKIFYKIALLLSIMPLLAACELTKGVSAPPPNTTRLKVNVSYVEVKEKNPKNESWDVSVSKEGLAPDLYYTISLGYEKKYDSKKSEDKYITQWLEPSDFIDIPQGKKIVFTFYDDDVSLVRSGALNNPDDYVGAIEFTAEELIKAAQEGKEFTFDSVIKCRFTVSNVYK